MSKATKKSPAAKTGSNTRRVKEVPLPAPKREPTPREVAQREEQRQRNLARPLRPESVSRTEGNNRIVAAAPNQDEKLYGAAMMEALGTTSIPFLNNTLDNIMSAMSSARNVTDTQSNANVAILAAIAPENELEATIGAQIVCANNAAIRCLKGMTGTDIAYHHQMYGNLANKFLRTSAALVESLSRLRRGGEQVVKHVHVNEGGQAVFAKEIHQNQGGRGKAENDEQPCGAGEAAERAALPCPDETRDGVPLPGHAERPMSPARRPQPRTAKG